MRLLLWLAILGITAGPTFAAGTTTVILGGDCRSVSVSSGVATCAPVPNPVVYTVLSNRVAMVAVVIVKDRLLTFVGESSTQSKPEEYVLLVSHVKLAEGLSGETIVKTAGACKVSLSADGKFVHSVDCDATDEHGEKYSLSFVGNGKPVTVNHF
jgi:hypothetical protein